MKDTPDFEFIDLPPIAQIGFVVADMDEALAFYQPMFGPFSMLDSAMEEVDYRGKPCDCRLRLAFGKSGDIEIELIQLLEGETPHREFLARGRTGMHHVRFDVDDIDPYVSKLEKIGYKIIWQKRFNPELAFCYLEREGDPLLIEFLQQPEQRP